MRKGQVNLLERARKRNFTGSRLKCIQDENLTLKQLKTLYNIFECMPDYPVRDAKKLVIRNGVPEDYIFAFARWEKEHPFPSYKELKSLPKKYQEPEMFGILKEIKRHLDGGDDISYAEAARFYESIEKPADVTELYDGILFMQKWTDYRRYTRYCEYRKIPREHLAYMIRISGILKNKLYRDYYGEATEELLDELNERLKDEWYQKNPARAGRIKKYIRQIKAGEYRFTKWEVERFYEKRFGMFRSFEKCCENNVPIEDTLSYILGEKECPYYIPCDGLARAFANTDRYYMGYEYQDEGEKKDIENLKGIKSLSMTIRLPYKMVYIHNPYFDRPEEAFDNNRAIDITFYQGSQCTYRNGVLQPVKKTDKQIVIFPGGSIFECRAKNKNKGCSYIPMLYRNLRQLIEKYGQPQIMDAIMSIPEIKNNRLFLDVYKDYQESVDNDVTFPPITWNEILDKHNRNDLMAEKYKNGRKINWNRIGLNRGYALARTMPYVDDKSRNVLYNVITNKEMVGVRTTQKATGKNVAVDFTADYLMKRLSENSSREYERDMAEVECRDYARNAAAAGIKLNLRINSLRKVQDKNTQLVLASSNEKTPEIMIPDNSVFLPLQEIFPKEQFEWITSRSRIIAEGRAMRHCVASYADFVNNDKSAIYHLEYKNRDYTVEIKVSGGKERYYKVNQIQSKADRGAPSDVWHYVEGLITDVAVPKKKKAN